MLPRIGVPTSLLWRFDACMPVPCEAGPRSGQCDPHDPCGSAGGDCSEGAAAEGVFGAIGAGSSQHRHGVGRSFVGPAKLLALFGTAAGRSEAAVCAARAQGGAAAVRCGPRFGVRFEGGWRAERRLVGWLVQCSRTGCCSLRPRRTGRKCRHAPVQEHGHGRLDRVGRAAGWVGAFEARKGGTTRCRRCCS